MKIVNIIGHLHNAVNSSRYRLQKEVAAFAGNIPAGSMVLDAGAGHAPYRQLFDHANYKTADFMQFENARYGEIDIVCDLTKIPLPDNSVDFILSTQVIEHVPEFNSALAEFYRLLKPGGLLFCTAPLFYEEHGTPYDYFRFTKYSWQHMLSKHGFKIKRIDGLEGWFGLLGYLFELMARHTPLLGGGAFSALFMPFVIVFRVLSLIIAGVFHTLEKLVFIKSEIGYHNYICEAQKPIEETGQS